MGGRKSISVIDGCICGLFKSRQILVYLTQQHTSRQIFGSKYPNLFFLFFLSLLKLLLSPFSFFFWDVALEPNPTSQGFYNGLKKYVCS